MKKTEKKIKTTEEQKEWFDAVGNRDVKTIKKMLEEGFDVNYQNQYGWTPLHFACYWGYIEEAKFLIDNGAEVNKKNKIDQTPLHIVCYWGYIEEAKFLIDSGADIIVRDIDGDTPLDKLKYRHHQEYEELMQWITAHHPEKMLEYMASESVQGKGVGL